MQETASRLISDPAFRTRAMRDIVEARSGGASLVMPGGDFLSTWGIPIGAGVAGLAVGLVIAKMARRRK